jgi:3-phosphoshikimate 1-carboxyvinyltransferase
MTQRALVIGALAARDTRIVGGLDCDDVERLTRGLQALGAIIEREGEDIRVRPGRLSARGQRLDLGNAGTALRFCAALSLVVPGELTLDGDARMRERPVGPLGDALGRLGVRVTYGAGPGCPPMTVERVSRPGASVQVDGGVSSQFASGLLLAAPQLESGLTVHLTGRVVSAPYLRMTTTMMTRAGARVTWEGEATIRVQSGAYFQGTDEAVVVVEPDWSAASFLLAGGFVCGRKVEVDGLVEPERSCQGDAVFGRMLDELAASTSHDFDLSVSPDLIAPLAIAALFAPGPTCIHGVGHARLKESDRIAVLAGELRKAGADVEERTDGLWIEPLRAMPTSEVWLDPHADHRMAMAFGLLSLRLPGLRVRDPGCVRKSFPSFWAQLDRLRSGGG